MEAEEAISLEELAKRCGCCFREINDSIVKEISTEIERKFVELVQYDVSFVDLGFKFKIFNFLPNFSS
jgi:hypothetical protein